MKKITKLVLFLLTLFYIGSCADDLEFVRPPISTESAFNEYMVMNLDHVDVTVLDSLRRDPEFLELVNVYSRSFLEKKRDSLISLTMII